LTPITNGRGVENVREGREEGNKESKKKKGKGTE
jgi:hypothetical protein